MTADLAHPHNRLIVDDYELADDKQSYRLRTVGTGEQREDGCGQRCVMGCSPRSAFHVAGDSCAPGRPGTTAGAGSTQGQGGSRAVLAQADHSLPPAMAPGQPTMPCCSPAACRADLLRFFRQHELHTILVPDVQARRHALRIAVWLFVWALLFGMGVPPVADAQCGSS